MARFIERGAEVKTRWIAFLMALALLLSVPVSAAEAENPEAPEEAAAAETPAGVNLVTDEHIPYIYGSGGAFPSFHPWRNVTRAEAAQMLFRLLPEAPELTAEYADVPEAAWYAEAVRAMGSLGVMGAGAETFAPGDEITRGEFVRCIASFFPLETDGTEQFPDVDPASPDAPYILSAKAAGWARGNSDGLFHPDDPITRAQAAVLLNRALGRSGDAAYILTAHPAFYLDVPPDSWFYADVMEASIAHSFEDADGQERWTAHTARAEVPGEGFQLVDGWLYYYDADRNDILRNTQVGGLPLNAAGRFTSGSAKLDGLLRTIVLRETKEGMTREERLRALYLYVRDTKEFKYRKRPTYAMGASDFMLDDALLLLETGRGNCYCYASLFWYLSRWIGYDSVIYSGLVGQNASPHAWVEIAFDGAYRIFDPELEMSYHQKGRTDVNLYKFLDAKNSWRYIRPEG